MSKDTHKNRNYPLVNITMPVWNRFDETLCTIASVARHTSTAYMLTVVDNGSDAALHKYTFEYSSVVGRRSTDDAEYGGRDLDKCFAHEVKVRNAERRALKLRGLGDRKAFVHVSFARPPTNNLHSLSAGLGGVGFRVTVKGAQGAGQQSPRGGV